MKMIWRCRCGKRVEKLTDDNFGCCGCSDPVYGPEYFYMTLECADMLDELDKNYDEQHKELVEAKAEIERKDKLIEQMREALQRTMILLDAVPSYAQDYAKDEKLKQIGKMVNTDGLYALVRDALAAERG